MSPGFRNADGRVYFLNPAVEIDRPAAQHVTCHADNKPHVPRVTAPGVVVEAAGAVVDVEGGVLVVEVELELVAGVAVRVDLLVHLGYGVKGDLK